MYQTYGGVSFVQKSLFKHLLFKSQKSMEDLKCKHTRKLSPTRTLNQCDQMLKFKVGQIISKVAQNDVKSVFVSKGTFFKIAQTSLYIWATFETKYFTQNLRKSPNLVTLPSTTTTVVHTKI